jgi:hypothetical protein
MPRRTIAAIALFVIVFVAVAIVPGGASESGSDALARGWPIEEHTVLRRDAELAVSTTANAHEVLVSTGDGGGAGPIDGFGAGTLRVAETTFRGEHAWEIGTAAEEPAAYLNDNGVRLDDEITDRLRARVLVLVIAFAVALALVRTQGTGAVSMRKAGKQEN